MASRGDEAALRRQRLINATIEVLGEVGAERLTMDMVAARAVYNYFPTRQELLAAVQEELLKVFRETLQLEIPETGDPMERLGHFAAVLYNLYEQQGPALTTLLEFDEPGIRAQIRDMRAWRRDRLEHILRSAGATLRLPLQQAVAFTFVLTNHVTWRVLREEMGLSQGKAIETTVAGLEAGLMGTTVSHTTNPRRRRSVS
jgi:AcrR family transcriptional regulator